MPLYKVYGRKYLDFYTNVAATDEYQALDIANSRPAHDWFQVEDDDVIEATDVYPEEEVQLNKDTYEWPSMESGILIEGTN